MRAVFRVIRAIPEIGALPGDCIVAEPADPTHPIVLTRRLERGCLPIVLDGDSLTLLDLEPGHPHPSTRPSPREPSWRRLKLVS